jgi:DNA-binding GntR family transcriptional regulator
MAESDFDPNPDGPGYVYLRLADHLTAEIESGRLPPNARLPGERELAQTYGVALGTARKAIEVLRQRELVQTWASKGTFVVRRKGQ